MFEKFPWWKSTQSKEVNSLKHIWPQALWFDPCPKWSDPRPNFPNFDLSQSVLTHKSKCAHAVTACDCVSILWLLAPGVFYFCLALQFHSRKNELYYASSGGRSPFPYFRESDRQWLCNLRFKKREFTTSHKSSNWMYLRVGESNSHFEEPPLSAIVLCTSHISLVSPLAPKGRKEIYFLHIVYGVKPLCLGASQQR